MSRVWYFAYGSNMQAATFRGRRGIEPTRALAARVHGWRLVLDKPPLLPVPQSYANLLPEPDAVTYGVAYEITADDLAHVDLTEGVIIGNYRRVEVEVEPLDGGGAPLRAHTLTSEKRAPELLPSRRYMMLLVEGARQHGLPDDWIAMLQAVPACEESDEARAARHVLDQALAAARRKAKPR